MPASMVVEEGYWEAYECGILRCIWWYGVGSRSVIRVMGGM